jgi:hypothetical protein
MEGREWQVVFTTNGVGSKSGKKGLGEKGKGLIVKAVERGVE